MIRRAAIALALLAGVAAAAETPIPPAPTHWLTDTAGMVSTTTAIAIDARLQHYEQATGHQVIVWIGTTLGDAPLEEWCAKAFAAWGIGRKGKDDGVAIFLFATDKKIRIEVGYGVEDVLPDAYAARIVHEVMEPALKEAKLDIAVSDGVDQVLSRLGKEPNGVITPALPARGPRSGVGWLEIIFGIIAGLAFLALLVTHPQLALMLLQIIATSGRGGGGGGGGGFSGGGGRSGGGGASGGW